MNAHELRPLPPNWRWLPISELITSEIEFFDKRKFEASEFVYIDITSVNNVTKQIAAPRVISTKEAPSRATYVVRRGDVLVSTVRPNLNAVALVGGEHDGSVCSNGFCVLRFKENFSPRYFFHYFLSPQFVSAVTALVQGAMYPAISDDDVRAFCVPFPLDGNEQAAIAEELGTKLTDFQEMRSSAERQIKAISVLNTAYLRAIFNNGQVESWPRSLLGEICRQNGQYGTSVAADSSGKGLPILRMGNISDGRLLWDNLKFVSLPAAEEKKYLLEKGDILFNRTNSAELVGKAAVFDGSREALFASYLIRFQLIEDLAVPEFITAYINSEGRRFVEANMGRAVGQVNISASTMHRMPVPVPPLAEQRRIAMELSARTASVEQIQRTLAQQFEAIKALPASTLRDFFNLPTNGHA